MTSMRTHVELIEVTAQLPHMAIIIRIARKSHNPQAALPSDDKKKRNFNLTLTQS